MFCTGFIQQFSNSMVPVYLYYSTVPISIISLILGFIILRFGDKKKSSTILFSLTIAFFFLFASNLVLWIAVDANIQTFVWFLNQFDFLFLPLLSFFLFSEFIKKNETSSNFLKIIILALIAIFIPIVLLGYNINYFDLYNCTVIETSWIVIYQNAVLVLSCLLMAYLAIKNIFSSTESRESKTKTVLLAVGLCSVLFSLFFTWNPLIFGYPDGVDQFGFIGAMIFLSIITYMVVKFKMFGMKLLATQALVWGLVILIGSQFFFIKVPVNFVLNGIGFLVAVILGQFLIKAVKKEIEAKENERLQHIKFEELANRFENINHILAHDVKNTLGKNRDIFVETLAGTFGEVTDQGKKFFKILNADTADVITSVNNLLKAGDRIKPDPKPFDFKQALLNVVVSTKDKADEKKIKIETQIDEKENYIINADRSLLVPHVLKNLIENAVAYGVQDGSVWINLSKKDSKTILLTVKDNGVGMTEEDKKVLYKPGGHGADSIKFNVHTTGFGLLIAKETMNAHNGKVYGISEGRGKGSTFFVELPIDFTTMPILSGASKI